MADNGDNSNGDNSNGEEPPLEQEAPLGADPEEGRWDDIHELHDPVMREHERPRDGFEPISVWLVMLFLALMGWGGWYLGAYSGAFRADVIDIIPLHEQAIAPEEVEPQPVDVDPMVLGEQMYTDCAACHQDDGQGVPGAFPPLVGTDRVLGDPAPLAAIILRGLEGPIQVQGEEYDDVMPEWDHFTDEEIAALLTYIRQSWNNDAGPVAESLVAAVRDLTEDQVDHWTEPQLEEFFADIDTDELGDEVDDEPEDGEQEEPVDQSGEEAQNDPQNQE